MRQQKRGSLAAGTLAAAHGGDGGEAGQTDEAVQVLGRVNGAARQGEQRHKDEAEDQPDEVFQSWGVETPKKFTEEEIRNALAALDNGETYGIVLRAKGIVPTADGTWLHFDHVPGEIDVRTGTAAVTGRLCVIGSKLDEKALAALFGV